MVFANYNDFELLYLVGEGSEQALHILYHKYNVYVNKIASKYFTYGDKRNDLIQEGLMIIHRCIKTFNQGMTVSFFSYFSISLHRRFAALLKTSYYQHIVFLKDNENLYGGKGVNYFQNKYSFLNQGKYFFEEELDVLIYKECIWEDLSVKAFSEKYNLTYSKVYLRKKQILKELKKILTII